MFIRKEGAMRSTIEEAPVREAVELDEFEDKAIADTLAPGAHVVCVHGELVDAPVALLGGARGAARRSRTDGGVAQTRLLHRRRV